MERSPSGESSCLNTTGSVSRFQCLECRRTFGRVEHLTRHSRSHMQERYLKCPECRKGFYRIDALRRHEQTHKEPRRSALMKGGRACIACAAARRKCSGEAECFGCQKRSLECRYPDSCRTRKPANASGPLETPPRLSPGEQPRSSEPHSMSWSYDSHPSRIDVADTTSQTSSQDPVVVVESLQNSAPFPSHSDPYIRQAPHLKSTRPPEIPDPDVPTSLREREAIREQPGTGGTSLHGVQPSQMTSNSNMNLDSTGTPMTWFQNNFSSINWLPEDFTPEFHISEPLEIFDQGQLLTFDESVQSNPSVVESTTDPFTSTQSRSSRRVFPSNAIAAGITEGQDLLSPGSQSTQSGGHYYVDGDGARLPHVGKAPYRSSSDSFKHALELDRRTSRPTFYFPEPDVYQEETASSGIHIIPANVYSEMFGMFGLTCVSSIQYPRFEGNSFPSLCTLSQFVHNYSHYFRNILPFTHPSTFHLSTTHWLLILAMATVGSHYSDSSGSETTTVALHEFLRRAIVSVIETGEKEKPDLLVLTQVRLLSCIGMMYSGDERLKSLAESTRSDLISFCENGWKKMSVYSSSSSDTLDVEWKSWCEAESSRRTGYCIWLLDCMWAFHFQTRGLLTLDDASVPIPCQEVLWEADSALDWKELYSCATPSLSLHSVIQLAYIEKRIQSSTGEFSRILCVHALFKRTWEVETHFNQPLTLWTPTAEKQDMETIESSMPIWLPGISIYAKWRNSACDCLDILHWHANSVIGAASGMEHTTVLHLHLARVILLTPYRHILQFADLLTSGRQPKQEDISSLRKHIQRWALEDQHKARLAMIHAGVLFWHVRRFTVDGFYEPSSVFLATLALWAYGSFAAPTSGINAQKEEESPQAEDDDAETLVPTSIQLDRPADDELVQLFVKRGACMKANITGVGNLCSAKGPHRVLIEGRNLLAGLKTWGSSRQAIRTLSALIGGAGTGVEK